METASDTVISADHSNRIRLGERSFLWISKIAGARISICSVGCSNA